MRQIFSWTVGSFFRTIGRTVALLGMGALLYYIASRLGFGLSDLFFDKVNAEEIGTYVIGFDETYYKDSSLTNQYTIQDWYQYEEVQTVTSLNQNSKLTNFYFNNHFDLTAFKGGYITIPFEMYLPIVRNTTSSTIYAADYCDRWDWRTIDSYNNVSSWGCSRVSQSQDSTVSDFEYVMPRYSINVNVIYNTGYVDVCSYNQINHTISCPITNALDNTWYINYLQVFTKVFYSSQNSYDYYIYLHKKVNAYSSAFNQLIESQNQNTQSIIEQNQNSTNQMLDTNSTATDQKADSFFGSFETNETYGGLSSIVTAPLVVVNQMLSNTCVAPSATWNGATITLPCGDMFWSRPGAVDLQNLLNVFYGGFICYYAIRKLFLMIENFKDPTHDKIEVTDL